MDEIRGFFAPLRMTVIISTAGKEKMLKKKRAGR